MRWLLVFVVLVVSVIVGIEAILSKILADQLHKTGIVFEDVSVTSVGLDGIDTIQIKNLKFPPEWNLPGITLQKAEFAAGYDFTQLIKEKKLMELTIKQLDLSVDVDLLEFEKTEKEPIDYRELPKIVFDSLPEVMPIDKLKIESGNINLTRSGEVKFSIPFQLSFDSTGALEIQAQNFQFKTTYNQNMGHAIAKLQFQVKESSPAIAEIVHGDFPNVNGFSLTGELSVSNKRFKDANVSFNLNEVQSKYGDISASKFRINCAKDLRLKNLQFESDFSNIDTDAFTSEKGRVEIDIKSDLPSRFQFESVRGYLNEQYYKRISSNTKVLNSQVESEGKVEVITGEVIPLKVNLDHSYVSKLMNWLVAPVGTMPSPPDFKELIDATNINIGPVVLEESEFLNATASWLPAAFLSGVINIQREPGGKPTRISVKDAAIKFPESGLLLSEMDTEINCTLFPDVKSVGTPELKIGKIQLSDIQLTEGKIPFHFQPTSKSSAFSTGKSTIKAFGGMLEIFPFSFATNGRDTLTFPRLELADLKTEEILKIFEDLPIEATGILDGVVQLKYHQQKVSIFSAQINVEKSTSIKLKVDAKKHLSDTVEEYSPEWEQMRRIESILSDLKISKFKINKVNQTEGTTLQLSVNHKSNKENIGLELTLETLPAKGQITANGKVNLFDETIPFQSSLAHDICTSLDSLASNPASEFPAIPTLEELLSGFEMKIGPVELSKSPLPSKLIPTLPDLSVTGTFFAQREKGNNPVDVQVNVKELKTPEQDLTVTGLVTNPSVDFIPAFQTKGQPVLSIENIRMKNWELKDGEFPWQILPPSSKGHNSILFTTGGEFQTLGGALAVGATSVELNGSRTTTTGRLLLKDIDFEKITQLTETPPLVLTGIFNGEIPFVFSPNDFDLKKGFLQMQSASDGRLEYDAMGRFTKNHEPGSRTWKNMNMAERALRNLNLSDIKLEFKPENDPDLPLRAYIKGSHEDNNKKINLELTLNLRGDIKEILQQAASGKLELVP